jgi:predicted DNA binding protein
MSRRTDDQTRDLFATEHVGKGSSDQLSANVTVTQKSSGRSIVPRDLHKAITYLDNHEFKRLFEAIVEEAGRRGLDPDQAKSGGAAKPSPSHGRRRAPTTAELTSGQVKAVRAAFRAGITVPRIARQFGLSQADVRKALSSVRSDK